MGKKSTKKTKKKQSLFKPRKIKIRVVGLGGGGSSIVSEMAQNLKGVSFLIADTDARVFKKARNKRIRVFQFGQKLVGGMGTGLNPEIARKAAEEEKEKIAKIFKDQDLVILVACLGGGVGSGAGPVFAEEAKNQRVITLGIFTLPFSFEGEKKMKIARGSLEKLRENLSAVLFVSNEKIFQLIDKKSPLKKALSALNKIFIDWLGDLIEVIQKPNLINIDFADLRTILKNRGKLLFFSQGTAQGANRVEELIKKLFQNPLFDAQLKGVKRILFNIGGGKDLGLKEVERISEAISRLNPRAKIIFGVSQSPNFKGKIKILMLAVSDSFIPGLERKAKRRLASTLTKRKAKPKRKEAKKKSSAKEIPIKKIEARKKKTRRTALEVKEAQEEQNEKEWVREPEWEIPAFLRRKIK